MLNKSRILENEYKILTMTESEEEAQISSQIYSINFYIQNILEVW